MSSGDGGGSLGAARLGRYQLLRKIAVGGMAEIYLARVSGVGGFEKNVVVKRILPQLAESDEFFAMFLDEARIAATLSHPNVVQIYDAGQAGSEFFIAMEYLDGADLHTVRRVLAERGSELPAQHAVFIVCAIASGLHYTHERLGLDGRPLDIVHRDVTPHNVFLTREGGVKLVDFGIAKATNRMSSTSYGTLKGKLAYMSPEQCRGEQVDRRSDIYSLGILLYELTTSRRLYRGKSEYELLREIVEGEVSPPSAVRADYPGDLEEIVMRALTRDPAERFPDALAFEQELEGFARRHSMVGSTLALAQFLAPLLDQAQRQVEARQRRRMSSAPPPLGEATDVEGCEAELRGGESEGDRQETVAGAPGRRHERPSTAATAPAARHVAARPPRTTPLPERVRGVTPARTPDPRTPEAPMPAAVLETVSLRPRLTLSALLALLLAAAGGAAAVRYLDGAGEAGAGEAPAGMKAAPTTRPEIGALSVTSDPPGAAVWLSLGTAPALSGPVDPARRHWIRVEQEGYRPRILPVEPSAFRSAAGSAIAADIAVDLAPASRSDADDRPLAEPTTCSGAAGRGPEAHIRVSTRPPVATVWLLVGVTPARVGPLATGRRHELRLAKDGRLPAFITVGPERFGDGGEARESASLAPAASR